MLNRWSLAHFSTAVTQSLCSLVCNAGNFIAALCLRPNRSHGTMVCNGEWSVVFCVLFLLYCHCCVLLTVKVVRYLYASAISAALLLFQRSVAWRRNLPTLFQAHHVHNPTPDLPLVLQCRLSYSFKYYIFPVWVTKLSSPVVGHRGEYDTVIRWGRVRQDARLLFAGTVGYGYTGDFAKTRKSTHFQLFYLGLLKLSRR